MISRSLPKGAPLSLLIAFALLLPTLVLAADAGLRRVMARVRELAQQQARIRVDLTVARADAMHRIYQVLTPEQQSEMADLLERRRAKWEAWRELRDAE